MLNRRMLLKGTSLSAAMLCSKNVLGRWPQEIPTSGTVVEKLLPFDELMLKILHQHQVPGAALAVAQEGEIIYCRGFGWSDRESQKPVQPHSVFRIASVSKPITSMAILRLMEQQKLTLDEPILPRLWKLFPESPAIADRRWENITVRHCLQHRGGWDRNISFDPISRPKQIAQTLGIESPVRPRDIIQYMISTPLDFEPGLRAAYSNFGYLVLGCLIEQASEDRYENYVLQTILRPLGCVHSQLGRARRADQSDEEVTYYDRQQRRQTSLYPQDQGAEVDLPYGAENFEAFEAHGGWISTTSDLLKFASLLVPLKNQEKVLSQDSISFIAERPPGAAGFDEEKKPRATYHGLGWMVRPILNRKRSGPATALSANLWHAGFIAGTEALLVHRYDQLQWCVLFNSQSSPTGQSLVQIIDPLLHQAAKDSKLT
jgi:CubicO group peptidase (beta-lactamase class C family)